MNRRLDSWKGIAEYLSRDQATLRRWEKTLGLPVRRVGGAGRSVFAYTDDIDAWLASPKAPPTAASPAPESGSEASQPAVAPRSRRAALTAVAASLSVILAATVWWAAQGRAASAPMRVMTSDRGFVALDARGRELWRYDYLPNGRAVYPGFQGGGLVVEGGDPAVYVATSHRYRIPDEHPESGELMAFSAAGRRERVFSFDDEIALRGTHYAGPWVLTGFAVQRPGAPPQVAVAAHHYVWSPSLVTVLDRNWKRTGTFVNDGWIETLAWLAPDRLALGGFLQERDAGLAIMLDTTTMQPLRMFAMPRSELNVVTASRFNRAIIQVLPDRVLVRTVEVPSDSAAAAVDTVYELTRDFKFVRASFSARYWEMHRALEAQGVLHHSVAECPDRHGPREMFAWDPAHGWQRQSIAASTAR